jgi:hypothetical protein
MRPAAPPISSTGALAPDMLTPAQARTDLINDLAGIGLMRDVPAAVLLADWAAGDLVEPAGDQNAAQLLELIFAQVLVPVRTDGHSGAR